MRSGTTPGASWIRAAAALALFIAVGCRGGPPAPTPVPVPGASIVRGTEHLAWSQAGDLSGLSFRAYVDDTLVPLGEAACDGSTGEATCMAPLPAMVNGVHTIALTSVLTAVGLESERSEPLVVQKISGGTASLSSLPDAFVRGGTVGLRRSFVLADSMPFAPDVVARGIRAPAQLAALPDGRLLVAEADGGIRFLHPGSAGRTTRAIDGRASRAVLARVAAGPTGLAVHPRFDRNHFVFSAFIEDDGRGAARLRVVRLRAVGETLGEAASFFETPVVVTPSDAPRFPAAPAESAGGPRLAFGPDGLLYIALPPGLEFHREPAASTPHASMIRIGDDGLPAGEPIAGVRTHPLGFAWDRSTGELWLAFADQFAAATIEPAIEPAARPRVALPRVSTRLRLPVEHRASGFARTLVVGDGIDPRLRDLARRLLDPRANTPARALRLTVPVVVGSLPDRIGDLVAGSGGEWFVVTSNALRAGGTGPDDEDVIVRMRPIGSR